MSSKPVSDLPALAQWLGLPTPRQKRSAEKKGQPPDEMTRKVRKHIEDLIYPARARADRCAVILGISPGHMGNRLRREGTTFTKLLDTEIRNRVTILRGEGLPEEGISQALGYDNFAAYVLAMRRIVKEQRDE